MERQNLIFGLIIFLLLKSVNLSFATDTYYEDSHFDAIAQSYCASAKSGWVFAIQRPCRIAPTCADMCKDAKAGILQSINNQRDKVRCFDALFVKRPKCVRPSFETEMYGLKVNYATYGYGNGGCTWTANHCGPNYCCCHAY